MTAFEKIYELIKLIPKGKVATYGMIAHLAGNPRWARTVGYALNAVPQDSDIPCHRVVNRYGKLSSVFISGGINRQRILLEREGVLFLDGNTVNLEKCLWNGLTEETAS